MKKSVRKVMACSLAAALAVTGLGDFSVASAAAKKPTKITMSASTVLVKVKKTVKLKVASVKPAKASKKVTYKVANKKIATVTKAGKVKGKKAGTTTVKVASAVKGSKATAKVKVIVAKVVPTKVTLSKKKASIVVGKTKKLTTTIKPKNVKKAHQKGTWSTNKKKVATVNKNGKITAKKVGTAKITFTTLNGKKGTCTVTVTGAAATTTAPAATTTPQAATTPGVTATDAPSQAPSEAPSQAPSEAPSQAPSEAPSEAPSQAPSEDDGTPLEPKATEDWDGVTANVYNVDTTTGLKFNTENGTTVEIGAATLEKLAKADLSVDKLTDIQQKWEENLTGTTSGTVDQILDIVGVSNYSAADFNLPADTEVTVVGEGATKTVTLDKAGDDYNGSYEVTIDSVVDGEFKVSVTSDVHPNTDVTVKDGSVTVEKDGKKYSTATVNDDGTIDFAIIAGVDVFASKATEE